ncbi:MAG: hypothetical protein JO307_06300 [Bryobacterales bacterium]|nr:hypothetical protein [Bryobacterales bacterium]MBV9397135.1 hypothetical protein [Bryobacterales bacterium]
MRFLLALFPICAFAQSGIDRPHLGLMLDREGQMRPVFGVAGNFLTGRGAGRALAIACSQSGCVAKLKDSIVSAGAVIPTPPGPAVIGLDSTGTVVYFRSQKRFARLQAGSLTFLDQTILDQTSDGEVLSVRSNPPEIAIAARREDGIRIMTVEGAVLDFLPPESRTALLLSDAVVYATADTLVLRRADGSELKFPAPGVRDLFAMGDGWVEARAAGAIYALRTDPGREHVYFLPESGGDGQR